MLLETSVQARFLIPMAITLAFGLLFATVVILLMVPSVYLIVEDVRALISGADPQNPTTDSTSSTLSATRTSTSL